MQGDDVLQLERRRAALREGRVLAPDRQRQQPALHRLGAVALGRVHRAGLAALLQAADDLQPVQVLLRPRAAHDHVHRLDEPVQRALGRLRVAPGVDAAQDERQAGAERGGCGHTARVHHRHHQLDEEGGGVGEVEVGAVGVVGEGDVDGDEAVGQARRRDAHLRGGPAGRAEAVVEGSRHGALAGGGPHRLGAGGALADSNGGLGDESGVEVLGEGAVEGERDGSVLGLFRGVDDVQDLVHTHVDIAEEGVVALAGGGDCEIVRLLKRQPDLAGRGVENLGVVDGDELGQADERLDLLLEGVGAIEARGLVLEVGVGNGDDGTMEVGGIASLARKRDDERAGDVREVSEHRIGAVERRGLRRVACGIGAGGKSEGGDGSILGREVVDAARRGGSRAGVGRGAREAAREERAVELGGVQAVRVGLGAGKVDDDGGVLGALGVRDLDLPA